MMYVILHSFYFAIFVSFFLSLQSLESMKILVIVIKTELKFHRKCFPGGSCGGWI